MPTVREVEKALYELAPRDLAQSWDNVGVLVGDPDREVTAVLVALDVTQAVTEEAEERGCDLIVAHHPLMNCTWSPVQSVRTDHPQGRLITTLIQNEISAICMHTNLDSTKGGVNDALAAALDLQDVSPLSEDGIGRIGVLKREMPLAEFAAYVKERLQAGGVRYADGGKSVRQVAVGGGACGEYATLAASLGCDTFVTADLKYHDFQNALGLGVNLLDAGHFPTENVVCSVLDDFLRSRFPGLAVICSSAHRDVIHYYI